MPGKQLKFLLARYNFWLAIIKTYARMACIAYHGFNDLNPFSFQFCWIVSIFLSNCAIFYIKTCVVFRKSACLFGQMQSNIYLPNSPFYKQKFTCRGKQVSTYVDACLAFLPCTGGMALKAVIMLPGGLKRHRGNTPNLRLGQCLRPGNLSPWRLAWLR